MSAVWRRKDEIAFVESDERVVVLDLERLDVPPVVLTDSAASIWRAIDGRSDEATIVTRLAEEFAVGAEQIGGHVTAFLQDLHARALITRA